MDLLSTSTILWGIWWELSHHKQNMFGLKFYTPWHSCTIAPSMRLLDFHLSMFGRVPRLPVDAPFKSDNSKVSFPQYIKELRKDLHEAMIMGGSLHPPTHTTWLCFSHSLLCFRWEWRWLYSRPYCPHSALGLSDSTGGHTSSAQSSSITHRRLCDW